MHADSTLPVRLSTLSLDDMPDGHPGAILVGRPLDQTRLPKSPVGSTFSNITGIVTYQVRVVVFLIDNLVVIWSFQFGYWTILPLTAPEVQSVPEAQPAPAAFSSGTHPCEITLGDYNVRACWSSLLGSSDSMTRRLRIWHRALVIYPISLTTS